MSVYTIHFFRDRHSDYRWHVKHANGNIVAEGGEGYRNYADAYTAVRNLFGRWRFAWFRVTKGEGL